MQSPRTRRTALLIIDLQLGLTHPSQHGSTRSTPKLESNVSTLLSTCRSYNNNTTTHASQQIEIIHIHHQSRHKDSLLHPSYTIDWSPYAPPSPDLRGSAGIAPLPCATPAAGERVLTKSVNSAFVGTELEAVLRGLRVRQLLVVGMTTEHCVSTTVRMAANLNVVGDEDRFGERGILLVRDGCACFGKRDGDWSVDAEMVHRVEVECLRDEFCRVVDTEEVIEVLRKDDGLVM